MSTFVIVERQANLLEIVLALCSSSRFTGPAEQRAATGRPELR